MPDGERKHSIAGYHGLIGALKDRGRRVRDRADQSNEALACGSIANRSHLERLSWAWTAPVGWEYGVLLSPGLT